MFAAARVFTVALGLFSLLGNTEGVMTSQQQIVVAVMPKITGFMSIIGSAFIVAAVLGSKEKRGRVYHRLLLAMGIFDVFTSFWFFMGSWPIPRGTEGVDMSYGTTWSCSLQGFFVQFGLVVPFYNAMLSVNYLLSIRYGWNEARLHKIEPFMHVGAIIWPLSTAIAALPMKLYNNANLWCWIAPLQETNETTGESVLIRGENAALYQWVFFYAELWACMLFCSIAMFLVVDHVRRQENRVVKYATAGAGSHGEHSKTRRVTTQALLYVGVFYLTWTFGTINRAYQAITKTSSFALLTLHSIFVPWQGFLNFLVYNRPYYLRYRDAHPDANYCTTVCMFFFCCCLWKTDNNDPNGVRTSIYHIGMGSLAHRFTSGGKSFRLGRRKTTALSEDDGDGNASQVEELEREMDQGHQELVQL